MSRFAVRTLTFNPSIDLSSEAEQVRPTHKTRTDKERIDPGGGGINVARVLHRFGTPIEAVFLAGGLTGRVLDDLLADRGIGRSAVPIRDDTRMSLTVYERSSGLEYRFVPEGPVVDRAELDACISAATAVACDHFVASGSLPRGAPADVYADLANVLRQSGARVALDTSGDALAAALAAGGLFLVKPSKGELEQLAGRKLDSREAIAAAAGEIVAAGGAEHVAVTLGREGAMLVNAEGGSFLPAVPVETRSAVGAGDSFLAGMVQGFVAGLDWREAFRLGAAAGAATALTPGTDLCHPRDVERLLQSVPQPQRLG